MDVWTLAKLRPMVSAWRKAKKSRWKAMTELNRRLQGVPVKDFTAEELREYDDHLHKAVEAMLAESELVCEMAEELES